MNAEHPFDMGNLGRYALYARRCYATTGVSILLWFTVNGAPMGSELPATGVRPHLQVTCHGANGLDHVRIVRNGRVVYTAPCHGEWACELEWEDTDYRRPGPAYYYVRVVQIDQESAWSSPVSIG